MQNTVRLDIVLIIYSIQLSCPSEVFFMFLDRLQNTIKLDIEVITQNKKLILSLSMAALCHTKPAICWELTAIQFNLFHSSVLTCWPPAAKQASHLIDAFGGKITHWLDTKRKIDTDWKIRWSMFFLCKLCCMCTKTVLSRHKAHQFPLDSQHTVYWS